MGIGEWIKAYYDRPAENYKFIREKGHFYWSPIYYLPTEYTILNESTSDPSESHISFQTKRVKVHEAFNSTHPPYASLKIESEEEGLVIVAKKRPSIIVSLTNIIPPLEDKRKLTPASALIVPLYTLVEEDGALKYSPEFITRLQLLEYPQFFYLPANSKFGIRESFARFDRIQAVHHVNLQPMNVKLHEDCSLLFFELLRYYLTGEIDEDVAEIKKELNKVLKSK